jgi:hypothetical protein
MIQNLVSRFKILSTEKEYSSKVTDGNDNIAESGEFTPIFTLHINKTKEEM